jgi:hypothetical protein
VLQDDEEALTRPATKVQVELGLSAYSNAAAHHAARKKQQVKQEKTLAAHAEALKAAEKKAEKQLSNLRTSGPAATVCRGTVVLGAGGMRGTPFGSDVLPSHVLCGCRKVNSSMGYMPFISIGRYVAHGQGHSVIPLAELWRAVCCM